MRDPIVTLAVVSVLILIVTLLAMRRTHAAEMARLNAEWQARDAEWRAAQGQWRASELAALQQQASETASLHLAQWRETELQSLRTQLVTATMAEAEAALSVWKQTAEESIRRDAIARSRSVMIGQITEHFIPYLPEFRYNPKDAHFLGKPMDFLVFDGLTDGDLRDVIFIEVKSGGALTARERQVRDAIRERRVRWEEIRRPIALQEQPMAHPEVPDEPTAIVREDDDHANIPASDRELEALLETFRQSISRRSTE